MHRFILVVLCFIGCAPDVDRFRDPVDASMVDSAQAFDGGSEADAGAQNRGDMEVPMNCTVTFQLTLPVNTPVDARVHIAGDFFGGDRDWQAGDATLALQRNSEGAAIELVLDHEQSVQYKYTLGNWDTVELVLPNCDEKPNRMQVIDCSAAMPVVVDVVDAWTGACP